MKTIKSMQKVSTGEIFSVLITGNNCNWNNNHNWEVDKMFTLPSSWKVIYEDGIQIPEGWRLLKIGEIKSKGDRYVQDSEIKGSKNLDYWNITNDIGMSIEKRHKYIRKIETTDYPVLTKETAINPRRVTIDNCKVGDKVIPGKDLTLDNVYKETLEIFKYETRITKMNYDTVWIENLYGQSCILMIGRNQHIDKELLLFLEDKQELQTSHNFKNNNNIKNGNKAIVYPVVATIRQGKRITGHPISGSTRKSSITSRHISYKPRTY